MHGARDEADAAFEWLERAYAQRDSGLAWLRTSLYFRSLHDDPRWGGFLKKMGLEDGNPVDSRTRRPAVDPGVVGREPSLG